MGIVGSLVKNPHFTQNPTLQLKACNSLITVVDDPSNNEASGTAMNTEILIYRIVGIAFLICLPVALAFVILGDRNSGTF